MVLLHNPIFIDTARLHNLYYHPSTYQIAELISLLMQNIHLKQHVSYKRSIALLVVSLCLALLAGCASNSSAMQTNNQGLRYWKDGRYDLAETTLKQALQQAEQDLGPNHYGVGITLVNLGLVYTDQGKYAEAIDVYQRADPILKKKYGSSHPTYAQFLNNYASAYLRYEKYTPSRNIYEQSLSIYTSAGKSDSDIANVINGLSMTYRGNGELTQAESIANRALRAVENDESKWGYKGPILQNLGTIYMLQGHYDKSEDAYKRVLMQREKKLGTSHPDTGRTVASLAMLYVKMGKDQEADEYFQRAVDIFDRRLPEGHPDMAQLVGQYADFLRSTGRIHEADELVQRFAYQQ